MKLKSETLEHAIVVPPAAVQRGPQGPYVYVVSDGGTASRRQISVGHEDAQASVVTDGLKPDETVVVDGTSRLTEGSKVTVAEPSAEPAHPGQEQPAAPGAGRSRRGRTASP